MKTTSWSERSKLNFYFQRIYYSETQMSNTRENQEPSFCDKFDTFAKISQAQDKAPSLARISFIFDPPTWVYKPLLG